MILQGYKKKYHKSAVLRLGPMWNSDAQFYTFKPLLWSDGPVKILGILIHAVLDQIIKLNYDPLIHKTESILHAWQNRTLTVIGKIQVIKTLVAPIFTYRFRCLPKPPTMFLTSINS